MARPIRQESIQICPEHCSFSLRGTKAINAACDAFLRRKEVKSLTMQDVMNASVKRARRKKEKRG